MKICDICNLPIENDWPDLHEYHEDDCPNFVDFVANPDAGSPVWPCDCNFFAHPERCPQCNSNHPTTNAVDPASPRAKQQDNCGDRDCWQCNPPETPGN